MRLIDRRDERYERLLVIDRAPNASATDTNARWFCRCDCGKPVIAYGQDLASGRDKSCGCLSADRARKHGQSKTPVYRVWVAMRSRCRLASDPAFGNYGARGIYVDERWEDFSVFLADMGPRPKGATLERKDNNGPYSKDNCRWATHREQHNNKRTNRMLTAFGRTQTVAQWAAETGLPWTTIRERLDRNGWPVEAALTEPRRPGRKLRRSNE